MFKFLIELLQYISEVLSFKCYLDDKTETFELFIGNNRTHKMKVFKIKIFAFIVASFAFFIDVVEFIFGQFYHILIKSLYLLHSTEREPY